MKTAVQKIIEVAESLLDPAHELFTANSSLIHDPINRPGDIVAVVSSEGEYKWQPTQQAEPLRRQLTAGLEKLDTLVRSVSHGSAMAELVDDCRKQLAPHSRRHFGSQQKCAEVFTDNITSLCNLAESLPDRLAGSHLYVADTNAIIYNTRLETWRFADTDRFTLVLTSTVLTELDQLGRRDGSESRREKCGVLHRQIADYRRRGDITEGVIVAKGKVNLLAAVVEPDFSRTLSWLHESNHDDRIIAATLDLVRRHPHCVVALITRDLNLQAKADLAQLYVLDPPAPPAAVKSV